MSPGIGRSSFSSRPLLPMAAFNARISGTPSSTRIPGPTGCGEVGALNDERVVAHGRYRKWRISPSLIIVHAASTSADGPSVTARAEHLGAHDLRVRLPRMGPRTLHHHAESRPRSALVTGVLQRAPARVRSSGLELVHLLVPVGANPTLDAAFAAHGGGRIAGAHGTVMGSVLLAIVDYLPSAPIEEFPRLAEALEATLLASLNASGAKAPISETARNAHLRPQVDKIIEANIGSARLDAERIAKLAGVSRATLYRLFDGCGGVATHLIPTCID